MISAKKLIKLARNWQRLATLPAGTIGSAHTSSCSATATGNKGHFVVYSANQKPFVLPLEYLKNEIVRVLLKQAEEEFGLPGIGPLTLPCDAALLEYAISLMKRRLTGDLEKA